MKEIELVNGRGIALVDDEDYEMLSQYRWYLQPTRCGNYAQAVLWNPRRSIAMHRMIMGTPMGRDVDHINHNGLDNQRCNLRECSHQENCANHRKLTPGSSKYKGVSWDGRKWQAYGKMNYRKVHLGRFGSEDAAAKAYNTWATEHFGGFALLNEI